MCYTECCIVLLYIVSYVSPNVKRRDQNRTHDIQSGTNQIPYIDDNFVILCKYKSDLLQKYSSNIAMSFHKFIGHGIFMLHLEVVT